MDSEAEVDPGKIAQPIPISRSCEMPSWKIEKAVAVALASLTTAGVPEPLPADYLAVHGLPGRFDALKMAHQPNSDEEWYAALKRCKHEEAFVLQALLAQRASAAISHLHRRWADPMAFLPSIAAFLSHSLRDSAVLGKARRRTRRFGSYTPSPAGDVGSGKTVVALRAMLRAVDAGEQAVLVAPTEVLASQHFVSFKRCLASWEGRASSLPLNRPPPSSC